MKTIHYSTKAKKDLKKYRNNIRLMEALYEVLSSLVKGEAVQENYKGCMECHVGNDFLLIWIDTKQDVIEVIRLDSHSELFK